jgi:ATP-dependent protease HslVU (ClpYQ) peptidase subunit
MSIAVAVEKNGTIALATDSQTNFGSERVPPENLAERKYRRVGDCWLAATGWSLYTNILDDVLASGRPPRLDSARGIFGFFRGLWTTLHERYNFVRDQPENHDSPFGDLDASFLVASPAGIFSVSSDLTVTPFARYFAIGSGAPVALGALHALYGHVDDAADMAQRAVHAAIAHDIYCGLPVNLETLRRRAPAKRRRGA